MASLVTRIRLPCNRVARTRADFLPGSRGVSSALHRTSAPDNTVAYDHRQRDYGTIQVEVRLESGDQVSLYNTRVYGISEKRTRLDLKRGNVNG